MIKHALFWLIISAQPLVAQSVVSVRSGIHDGFTRLVLDVGPNREWQMEESRGAAVITFPDQALSFATDEVFDRISTARISAVAGETGEGSSTFRVELACACEVKSSNYSGQYIVIDVFDGPELDAAQPPQASNRWQPDGLSPMAPPASAIRFSAAVMLTAPQQPSLMPDPVPTPVAEAQIPEGAALAAPQAPDIVAEIEASVGGVVSEMNAEVAVEDSPALRARIEAAQTQLLAQLTRAADQGLVEFIPTPVVEIAAAPEPEPQPEPEPDMPPAIAEELLQQLSARSAYARTTEDALSEIVNQFAMPQCLEDAAFLMEGWGGDSGFSARLAKLRTGLLKEFDKVDQASLDAIIKLYLRYGLGAEARMLLLESGDELSDAALLKDMAEVLELRFSGVNGPISQGAGCGGAHEMWYLATGRGDYQVLEPLAITDIFSSYPIEIRALIGPPLANAFIARGQADAAHVVLEIVRRAEGEVTVAQRMAEARVREAQSDPRGAENIYRELIGTNDELAPDAMIALARLRLKQDAEVPASLLLDLEAAAFFNRNTEKADPLRLWEIRVRAAVEGPDKALAQISETLAERDWLAPELKSIAADIFTTARAAEIGDYLYAQMALEYFGLLDQGPSGDAARLSIAKELADIGLPETALDIIAPNLERPNPALTRLVASAKVQLFQPETALQVLEGATGIEAYKIRLQAYLQMEDFAAVAALLNDDYAHEISLDEIALRAGDW